MNKEMKQLMAEPIRDFRLPRYAEIPNMGLYLEQTTKYINGYLEPLDCMEITSSMISNYVKKGLIPKPIKKQYFAEHIAHLFFVVIAKNLVSMENIGWLLEIQRSSYSVPIAYDYICDELENSLFYLFGIKESLDDVGTTHTYERELLSSLLFSAANIVYMHAYLNQIRKENDTTGGSKQ